MIWQCVVSVNIFLLSVLSSCLFIEIAEFLVDGIFFRTLTRGSMQIILTKKNNWFPDCTL